MEKLERQLSDERNQFSIFLSQNLYWKFPEHVLSKQILGNIQNVSGNLHGNVGCIMYTSRTSNIAFVMD